MKKFIFLFLFGILMLVMSSGCSPESPIEDFEYEVNSEGTGVFITKYIGSDDHVVIPSKINGLPVTSIGKSGAVKNSGAFQHSNIREVVIPDSVMAIMPYSFSDCANLRQVLFGDNSKLVDMSSAFENCTALKEIDLSTTKLKEVGACSFSGCASLREIQFPNTLLKIGEKAFYGCSSLLEVDLPENLTEIDSLAFDYCTSLKRVILPPNLNLIALDSPRFHNLPSLEQIVFEDGREAISGYAFFGITSNVKITIPASVEQFNPLSILPKEGSEAKIEYLFLGDCPKIIDDTKYRGPLTILYDPSTTGWTDFEWKDNYTVLPVQK